MQPYLQAGFATLLLIVSSRCKFRAVAKGLALSRSYAVSVLRSIKFWFFFSSVAAIIQAPTFIGLNDIANEGVYVWHEGGHAVGYTNWAVDEPAVDSTKRCVSVSNTDGTWKKEDCGSSLEGLCQF